MAQEETPKLHIDTDWKAQAQAEKERLAAAEAERKPKAGAPSAQSGGNADEHSRDHTEFQPGSQAANQPGDQRGNHPGGELPEASFRTLMGMLASQAVMGLGAMVDPETKGVMIDLEGSRFAIDLLEVLGEKTKGNLEDAEASELRQLLAELRNRYVQVTQLVAKQAASGGIGGAQPSPEIAGKP